MFLARAWHFTPPAVSIGRWMFPSAGRLLFSRLPLLPHKDLLFANFAILFVGQKENLPGLIAFSAAPVLTVHIILIVAFSLHRPAIRSVK